MRELYAWVWGFHYNGVIMSAMASQITGISIVYSTVCSGAENISAPRHWPLCGEFTGDQWFPAQRASKRKMFSFDDVIMSLFGQLYGTLEVKWYIVLPFTVTTLIIFIYYFYRISSSQCRPIYVTMIVSDTLEPIYPLGPSDAYMRQYIGP